MAGIVIELELSPQQYAQLTTVAHTRRLAIVEAAHLGMTDWLEREVRLVRARALMRQLGHGLGEWLPAHNVARTHDAHLYGRPGF